MKRANELPALSTIAPHNASRRPGAFMAAIGTFAPRSYRQDDLLHRFDCANDRFVRAVSPTSNIETRCFFEDPADYRTASDAERQAYHERSSVQMAASALKDAAGARFDLAALDAVIVVNSSGFSMPGVAVLLGEQHGVGRRNALRFNLVGHGCVGAVPGLQLATGLVRSGQARTAAVVCTEPLLSVLDPAMRGLPYMLSRVIFGEGAAAVIVTDRDVSEGRLPEIVDSEVLLGEGSLGHVSSKREDRWTIRLDRRVPEVGGGLATKAVGELFQRHGLSAQKIDRWAFHTGGRKILDACQAGFDLGDAALQPSRDVLRSYGNIQSGSALFSLRRSIELGQPKAGELGCLVAIGPGMLAGGVLLEWHLGLPAFAPRYTFGLGRLVHLDAMNDGPASDCEGGHLLHG